VNVIRGVFFLDISGKWWYNELYLFHHKEHKEKLFIFLKLSALCELCGKLRYLGQGRALSLHHRQPDYQYYFCDF